MKFVRGAGSFRAVRAVISAVVVLSCLMGWELERRPFCQHGKIIIFDGLAIHVRAILGPINPCKIKSTHSQRFRSMCMREGCKLLESPLYRAHAGPYNRLCL